jgi:2-dehydropantoate 2-reductase
VRIAPVSGLFIIGRYGPAADASDAAHDAELLDAIRAEWERASFRVHLVDDVVPWKHRKLLGNLGNAIQALIDHSSPSAEAIGAELHERARQEGLAVYAASGIGIPTDDEEALWREGFFDARPVPGIEGPLGGSSWQSLARGSGSIESDYLNGEIVRLARQAGMPAPVNEALQRLARRAAAERLQPGSLQAEELKALVLGE